MGRVYIANTECVIITTTTTTVVTTTTTLPITTTTTTQDWSLCTQCPPGYDAVAQGCIQYDEVAATYSGTTYTVVKKTSNAAYSVYGGLMFSSWNYNGTGTFERFGVSPVNTYWTNQPYNNPGTLGVMNRTSVWGSTTLSNQDIGFSVCVNIDIPKTYYIGFGCDNYGKIKLNGTMILEQDVAALKTMFGSLGMSSPYDDGVSFKYWYVYPVYLPQGQNVIEVFGHNVSSVAAVGIEIYDATPAKIMTATSDSDLTGKFLFRSQDLVGEVLYYEYSTGGGFHGYSCAEGYALSTCDGTVMCVKRDFIPCQGGTTTTTTALVTTTTTAAITTTTTASLITTTTTTSAEVAALIQCISDAFIADVDLGFTPKNHYYIQSLVEDSNYIYAGFGDTYEADYLWSTVFRYKKSDGTTVFKRLKASTGVDYHKNPYLFITSTGALLEAVEEQHNGAIHVYRWADPSDLDTYTETSISGSFAYPEMYEVGGNIIIDVRGYPDMRYYAKSSNDGVSFSAAVQYADYANNTWWLYTKGTANLKMGDNPIILFNPLYHNNVVYKYVSVLRTNYTNFYSLDGTDLGTSLTRTEIENENIWGDIGENQNSYVINNAKIFGDSIYFAGVLGTGDWNLTGQVSMQVVKVNLFTGVATLGTIIDNPLPTDTFYYTELFNVCDNLYMLAAYQGDIYYYKISQDLNTVTYMYKENGNSASIQFLNDRFGELCAYWDTTTDKIKIWRFSPPDVVWDLTTTTTTTIAVTTTTTVIPVTTTTTTGATTTTTTSAVTTTTTTVSALKQSLLSVWEMDETSGTTASDQLGYANLAITGATVNQTGKINTAYLYDATTEKLLASSSTPFNFERTNSFSVSAWIYRDTNNVNRFIVGKQDTASNYRGWEIWQNTGNLFNVDIVNFAPNTNVLTVTTPAFTTTATWTHIVMTYDGSSSASGVKFYINGTSQTMTIAKNTLSATTQSTVNLEIGNRNGAFNFAGKIDQCAIWNRVLSQTDVNNLYNSGNGLAYTSW